MSEAIGSDPDLLRFMNDIRWEFPGSVLWYVKVGDREFGDINNNEGEPELVVDLLEEERKNREEREAAESFRILRAKQQTILQRKKTKGKK